MAPRAIFQLVLGLRGQPGMTDSSAATTAPVAEPAIANATRATSRNQSGSANISPSAIVPPYAVLSNLRTDHYRRAGRVASHAQDAIQPYLVFPVSCAGWVAAGRGTSAAGAVAGAGAAAGVGAGANQSAIELISPASSFAVTCFDFGV